MKFGVVILFIITILFGCNSEISDSESVNEDLNISIEDVNWLIGSWQDSVRPGQWEVWTKNEHGLYGRGMAIKSNDTVIFEELSLIEDNGNLVYIASVKSNDRPVRFEMTESSSNSAQFENPHHDFPKIIHYQTFREGEKQVLHATVGSGNKKIELFFVKQ